jgi:hypothetical protein
MRAMATVVIRMRRINPIVLFGFRGIIIFLVLLPLILAEEETAIHCKWSCVFGGG